MEERFYFCNTCGNLMLAAIASGVVPHCCGEKMTLLEPNAEDGDKEKHLPVITYTSNHSMKVRIGSKPHPMSSQHNIRFICLETSVGIIVRYLDVGDNAEACIHFDGKPIAVYAYCNLHGLWRVDAPEREAECKTTGCQMM